MTTIGTALSGLQAGMARMTASASNIANARSDGAIAQVQPSSSLNDASSSETTASTAYQPIGVAQGEVEGGGVTSHYVVDTAGWAAKYDPTSPHADESGMVATPDVDITEEIVNQRIAQTAAQANIRVIETAGRTDRSILEIWA